MSGIMAVAEGSEFWHRLARRISDELRVSKDNHVRFLWVDGFIPGTVASEPADKKVLAKALVSEDGGRSFVHYRICIYLSGSAAQAFEKGEWSGLVPPSEATGWLTINRANMEMEIENGRA
jgi:hypothetical protein